MKTLSSQNNCMVIPGFVFILAALTALAPLSTDAYLPAIPTMALDFNSPISDIELSLSFFLGGFSIGQLIGGPFSDHFGRRASIFFGLILFVFGSILITLSTKVEWLWIFRILQSFGGGITVVNTPAIVKDIFSGRESAITLSRMSLILMLAPILGPIIGNIILQTTSWQMIFVFLIIYGLTLGFIVYRFLPETREIQTERQNAIKRYLIVIINKNALGYLFSYGFCFASLFALITGSPTVYMGYFNLSENIYPFAIGCNVVALLIGNKSNIILLNKIKSKKILVLSQVAQIIVGFFTLVYIYFEKSPDLYYFIPLLLLFFCFHTLITTNSLVGITDLFPKNSATATSMLGASGYALGALSGSLVGFFSDGTPLPMVAILFSCAILGGGLRIILQHRN